MYTIEEYEAKRSARYERLQAAAARAEKESSASLDQAHSMASIIPFGQPILVGHHSERGDRNYRARIDNKYRKGFELMSKAKEYKSRAASMEANDAIFSDDPQAVEKLDDKLEGLLARQARYKAINAAHAKYLKNAASLDKCELSESDKTMIRNYVPEYSWTPHPIAPYRLTNLSANIRNAQKRAALVEKKQAIPDKDEEINGVKIEWRASENRIRLYFQKRVDMDTFKKLKAHGYRVLRSEGEGAFSAYYNWNAGDFVNGLKSA